MPVNLTQAAAYTTNSKLGTLLLRRNGRRDVTFTSHEGSTRRASTVNDEFAPGNELRFV